MSFTWKNREISRDALRRSKQIFLYISSVSQAIMTIGQPMVFYFFRLHPDGNIFVFNKSLRQRIFLEILPCFCYTLFITRYFIKRRLLCSSFLFVMV